MNKSSQFNIRDVILDFIQQNKASIFGYLFFSLAVPISNVYLPHLYGKIIAELNNAGEINKKVQWQFISIILLWIMVQVFWAGMNVIDSVFIPKLRSHIRKYIVDRVLETYSEDYSEEELGGIMAEIVRLPDEVDHMFSNIRNHIMPMFFMLVFTIGYFTWTNPKLGAVGAAAIGLYLAVAVHFSKKCLPKWANMNVEHTELHGEINDCFGNLLNIYTANQNAAELQRLDGYEAKFNENHRQAIQCSGNFRLALNLSYIALFCSVNLLSFYLFSQGNIEISQVVSILIITLELISKMASFIGSIDRIMYEMSTIQHVQNALDTLAARHSGIHWEGSDQTHASDMLPPPERFSNPGDVDVEDLRVVYDQTPILRGINVSFPQNSITVLAGEIGSGKTTLINSIIRLVPYTGTVRIGGVDTKTMDLGKLREQVLYVPQNPRLFNRTIYENICYGQDISKDEIKRVLGEYGLNIDLDRKVGKFGQSLSGGQRQIVYLLRCLFRKSPIILLDEPTSSLDQETKRFIMNILRDLLSNRTVVIITHDQDVLQYADRVIRLDKGQVVNTL